MEASHSQSFGDLSNQASGALAVPPNLEHEVLPQNLQNDQTASWFSHFHEGGYPQSGTEAQVERTSSDGADFNILGTPAPMMQTGSATSTIEPQSYASGAEHTIQPNHIPSDSSMAMLRDTGSTFIFNETAMPQVAPNPAVIGSNPGYLAMYQGYDASTNGSVTEDSVAQMFHPATSESVMRYPGRQASLKTSKTSLRVNSGPYLKRYSTSTLNSSQGFLQPRSAASSMDSFPAPGTNSPGSIQRLDCSPTTEPVDPELISMVCLIYKHSLLMENMFPETEKNFRDNFEKIWEQGQAQAGLQLLSPATDQTADEISRTCNKWRRFMVKLAGSVALPTLAIETFAPGEIRETAVSSLLTGATFAYSEALISKETGLAARADGVILRHGFLMHPCIRRAITSLLVTPEPRSEPSMAGYDPDTFRAIPIPTIAFACVAVHYALEKLRAGKSRALFLVPAYQNHYKLCLSAITNHANNHPNEFAKLQNDLWNEAAHKSDNPIPDAKDMEVTDLTEEHMQLLREGMAQLRADGAFKAQEPAL